MKIRQRVAALRVLMVKHRVDAYLAPSTDAHQSEYVPTLWRRREWISGFSGSSGDVVITARSAALWTDGRYFLQAASELAGSGITLMKLGQPGTPTIAGWLSRQLKRGSRVGVDPRLLSGSLYRNLRNDLAKAGIDLVSVETNLIDVLWIDRPEPPSGTVEPHPVRYSGLSYKNKLKAVRGAMRDAGAGAHVISALDAIAWLFNIRGSDVLHNPVVIAYAIVTAKRALLFVAEPRRVAPEIRRAFGKHVLIRNYSGFRTELQRLSRSRDPVWVDPTATNQWIFDLLKNARLITSESPITLSKAQKNTVELRGARAAHVRDGAALVRFLHWLDEVVGREPVTEISAADKLLEFRRRSGLFRGLSFDTISGYAEHGAIIHYSATPRTDVRLRRKGLYLIDSGAQYLDGTTDITRTVALGKPTREQRAHFTRVLKGHIQLATQTFPQGTAGRQLDTLARKFLWDAGLDYGHGTGHGVGSYLSVHEGPQSISHSRDTGVPLAPGMICSNEPGYYQPGEYGIRIENLIYVVTDPEHSKSGRMFLTFENLSLCPIDLTLIEPALLTRDEIRYLNAYHAEVRHKLARLLNKKEAAWLAKATRPIR